MERRVSNERGRKGESGDRRKRERRGVRVVERVGRDCRR